MRLDLHLSPLMIAWMLALSMLPLIATVILGAIGAALSKPKKEITVTEDIKKCTECGKEPDVVPVKVKDRGDNTKITCVSCERSAESFSLDRAVALWNRMNRET